MKQIKDASTQLQQACNLLYIYVFFLYFSLVFQLLLIYNDTTGYTGLRDAIYFTSTFILLPLLIPHITKYYLCILGILLWLTSCTSIIYLIIFKQEISQSIFFTIFETNYAEGFEFFGNYYKWWMLFFFFLYTIPPIYLYSKIQIIKYDKKIIIPLLFICLFFNFQPFLKKGSGFNHTTLSNGLERLATKYTAITGMQYLFGYYIYVKEMRTVNALINEVKNRKFTQKINIQDTTKQQTYVLVIGESTNRERMGLYGHTRPTSPLLTSIKNELMIFDNVITPRPATIAALYEVLTFKHGDETRFLPNVMTVMKSAGFKTFWISNQQTISKGNSLLTAFSLLADEKIYLNSNRLQSSVSYDAKVLEPFNNILNSDDSDKKFIVIHLIGTHGQYSLRYPKEFDIFHDSTNIKTNYALLNESNIQLYNNYDNAVLYNDYVVYNIIKNLKDSNQYGALLYFSDHGEEVFDSKNFYGRNELAPTKAMYTIPFLVWGQQQWKLNHNTQWNSYLNRSYSTRDMMHSICDLTKIEYELCDNTKSVFSKTFVPKERLIGDPTRTASLKNYDTLLS